MSQINNYIPEEIVIIHFELLRVDYARNADKVYYVDHDEYKRKLFIERINALDDLAERFNILDEVVAFSNHMYTLQTFELDELTQDQFEAFWKEFNSISVNSDGFILDPFLWWPQRTKREEFNHWFHDIYHEYIQKYYNDKIVHDYFLTNDKIRHDYILTVDEIKSLMFCGGN